MIGTVELVAIAVAIVVVVRWVVPAWGDSGTELRRWTDATGTSPTPDQAAVVERYLARSRLGRRVGAVLGFASPWVYAAVTGTAVDEGAWALTLMLVGYLVGSVVAEVGVHRARDTSAAVVRPRRLEDYLAPRLLLAQRALGLVALGLLGPYAVLEPDATIELPSVGAVATYALGAVAIAAVVEAIERSIVSRRQSLSNLDDVEIDDAMRATSLRMVGGAGLALLIQFAGPLLALCLAAAIPGEAGGIVAGIVIVVALLASLLCWRTVAHPRDPRLPHRVRTAG